MELMNAGVATDVVADLLDSVRVRATIFCRSTLRAPWGFAVKPHANPSFHAVTQGDCWLALAEECEPRRLRAGDLVILPHGVEHRLCDRPSSPTVWLEDLLETTPVDANGQLRYGGGGAPTELVCGGFVLEAAADPSPILRSLPRVVHVRGASASPAPWVSATLDLVAAVTGSAAPGADAVLARLAETMLAQAVRVAFTDSATAGSQPIGALRDPQIARAVHLIHERPQEPWTIDDLAAEVAYSRSAFALRFRELVGEPPIAYLRRTRLARAAMMLQQTDVTLVDVARRTGYATEASLSRAFKRAFGITPGVYRSEPEGAQRLSDPDLRLVRA
jgi:AraC-like DNA-binding protein